MAKKREGASFASDAAPSGQTPAEETPNLAPGSERESKEQVGFTGLPIEEQRSNFIKLAIFLAGSAGLVAGLKWYFGW